MAIIIFLQAIFMAIALFCGIGLGYENSEIKHPNPYIGFKTKKTHEICKICYLIGIILSIIMNYILFKTNGLTIFFQISIVGTIFIYCLTTILKKIS